MSGLNLIVSTELDNVLGVQPPVTRGLIGLWIPGELAFSETDQSDEGNDAQFVALTQDDWNVIFAAEAASVTSYLDTLLFGVDFRPPCSLVSVQLNGTSFGNYDAGNLSSTFSMQVDSANGQLRCQAPTGILTTPQITLNADYATRYQFYGASIDHQGAAVSVARKIYNGREGVLTTATANASPSALSAASTIHLKSPDKGVTGMVRHGAFYAAANVVWTADEFEAWFEWAQAYFAGRLPNNGL